MLQILEALFRKMDGRRYKRNIRRALALHLRGEVRADGLTPIRVATHFDIEWHARDVHPWDRGLLSPAQRAEAFVQQSLTDTEAAICRLFEALPQVDVLAVKVLDRRSESVIISGSVSRLDFAARDEQLSMGMRLRYLGLVFHSSGLLFEPIEEHHTSSPAQTMEGVRTFQGEEALAMYRRGLNGR
jgi:hypothetical protein